MGDWTQQLEREATTRVLAQIEAPDAGLVCTENEVLFLNAGGLQRAPLSEITKVSRDGPDLVLSGATQTFVRGSIQVDKLTLANFFSEVKQAATLARSKREVLLDTSVPPTHPTQNIAPVLEAEYGRAPNPSPSVSPPPPPVAPNLEPPRVPQQQQYAPAPRLSEAPRLSAAQDEVRFQPASFWWRWGASIIDGILLSIVGTVLFLILGGGSLLTLIAASGGLSDGGFGGNTTALAGGILGLLGAYLVWLLLIVIGSWLYYALLESSDRQGTLGKIACGLFVSDLGGQRISFGQASARFWVKAGLQLAVSILAAIIGAIFGGGQGAQAFAQLLAAAGTLYIFLTVFWTPRRQTVYDQITGTLVWKR
jgi:uncharacterized RDD family membrane protein YckC